MRRLTIAFLAACLLSVGTNPATAQLASPEPAPAVDVSAIDAETLRLLCVARALDEGARVACLDIVEHGLLPMLGLAPDPVLDEDRAETVTHGIGDWVTVHEDGTDVLRMKVTKVKPSKTLRVRGFVEKPQRHGNVLISAYFRYEALADDAIVSPQEWRAYNDGEQQPIWVPGSMHPSLEDGVLSEGRTASGWVTFEVPKRGQVIIERDGLFGGAPVEIVLRER